ncbi:isoform 2 of nuclear receptor corepressor 1 [Fagus crenata]
MPPEPLPWDRKERKHDRSSESLGSVARWREPSHHGSREFARWGGSADCRRPPGHGKQGGWHQFPEESGHGYVPSRSGDKMLDDENFRQSLSRGDGKYGRSSRENRFSQRDWKGSWETGIGSPNTSGRLLDVSINDPRSLDDIITCPTHANSDFVNTWDPLHLKDQHDKMGGVNGSGTGQRCDRENSLGSTEWKPMLKWSRSGSLSSSRGSGFSHSSSSKSMGGVDSNEMKADIQPKNSTPVQSPSGDAAACVTSAAQSEETTSKKKPRLGWGEGLAKYEKKKVEGPEVSVNKDGAVFSTSNTEPTHSFVSNMADKSPRVTGFSECASPATPSSVACSSSPGVEDKSFGKAANIDNDISNLCVSPSPGSQNLLEGFPFNLEKLDTNAIANLGSSLIELLLPDDTISVYSSFERGTAINKLLIYKSEISKALEMTESEIDSLENELKLLKSEFGSGDPCPAASSSLPVDNSAKPCNEQDAVSSLIPRPAQLQVVYSGDTVVEKMPLCNGALEEVHEAIKDDDMDSPGTATSKFVEPLSLVKAVSSIDKVEHGDSSGNLDAIQLQSRDVDVKCSVPGSGWGNTGALVSNEVSLHTDGEGVLCDLIMASNRECANRASEAFKKLLPRDQCMTDIFQAANFSSYQDTSLIKEKFAMRKQFLRFKERVVTLKFKAFQHLWKEDMRLLSVRKHRPKSKKFDLSLRTTHNGNQKHRSSIRSRFSSPAGNLSLVPTTEIVNFTSKLLSDSQVKLYRNALKMPALILDKKEKIVSRFISSNGLIEDPCAAEKERAIINPWTSEEKEIFMDKLVTFGKDFRKIASFLDHKTTADCVEFYYKNHKSDCFEKTKKQDCSKQAKSSTNTYLLTSGKKWNREMNAASLDMLGAASMMAARADDHTRNRQSTAGRVFLGGHSESKTLCGDDGMLERSSSLDILANDRETVAADVLAGICGSLSSEAMSSCITSSVDPGESYREWKCQKVDSLIKRALTPDVTQDVDDETCSDESCGEMDPSDWTDEEKSIFIQAVSSYGKDFVMISRCVRTRSRDQCKVFFSKARKCLGLDLMQPGPRNVGEPMSDDANGGGSDTEDACVVETGETGSAICGSKSGCRLKEDLPLSTVNMNHDESDPAKIVNFQSDLNRSQENNEMECMDDDDFEAVDTLVSGACQTEDRPKLDVHVDSNIIDGVKNQSDSVHAEKNAVALANTEVGGDQVIEQGILIVEPVSVGEAVDSGPLNSEALAENKAVASEGFENELERQDLPESSLNDRQDEKCDVDTSGQSGFQCLIQDSTTTGNASHLAAESSCSGFSLKPEYQHKISFESESMEKPHISLSQQNSPATATSVSQDSAAISCDKASTQDRLSSALDYHGNRDKHPLKFVSRDDFHQHLSGRPLLNHVESSQILRGYPLHISNKKEMNGDVSCAKLSEGQNLSQSERNISTGYMAQDCFLQKCSSSKPHCPVAELPLLSQKREQTSDHSRAHSRSLSDTDKPCRNGDVKLFGQILSHPSSTQKSNSSTHENEEKGMHNPKSSSSLSNLKVTGLPNVEGNSTLLKIDANNFLVDNVPLSYGFWDGNRRQTGFSSFPDSALLLAKYPNAFANYPTPSTKIELPPALQGVKSNERNLNGVSVFPTREISSSNGLVDYQVYRSREGPKTLNGVPPFSVEMKQRQDIFSEMQRRNGFEAVSSLQSQGRGMVGMNVVGRGVLVGGPCTSVSDPVAAIKMHYAKTDQYGGQTGSIIREEESWRGKGDIGR